MGCPCIQGAMAFWASRIILCCITTVETGHRMEDTGVCVCVCVLVGTGQRLEENWRGQECVPVCVLG